MRTLFRGSNIKMNGIFGISMIKSMEKDAKIRTFQAFVGIDPPYDGLYEVKYHSLVY